MSETNEAGIKYIVKEQEVTKEDYFKEWQYSDLVYGSVVVKTGYFNRVYIFEILDYPKLFPDEVIDCLKDKK